MVSSHQLLEEAFGRGNIAPRAEHKLDGIPGGVDGSVQVSPLTTDLDVGLVDAVGAAARQHKPLTYAQQRLLEHSVRIFDEPAKAKDAAYMPRELVQVGYGWGRRTGAGASGAS